MARAEALTPKHAFPGIRKHARVRAEKRACRFVEPRAQVTESAAVVQVLAVQGAAAWLAMAGARKDRAVAEGAARAQAAPVELPAWEARAFQNL